MAAGAGNAISEVDVALLNDVDFKGFPSVRANSGCWKSASFVVVVQMAERISYHGISSNMVSYLTGGMGQSTAAAAANLNAWYGTASLTPILGAFLADKFLGRFWTVTFSSLLYVLGLGFLTISAVLNPLNSPECKTLLNINPCSPSQLQMIFFFSLYIIAIAQGGHTPCLQAFGADQFDVEDEKELQEQTSFFNWSFWFSRLGIFTALLVVNYIQENLSWELGFGIPTIVMCFAFVVFLAGTMTYRFSRSRDGKLPYVRISRSNEVESQQNLPQECPQF